MNKKGFTLMELLAVIVVLGLVAIIILPKLISTIDGSEKNSNKISINNLINALNGIAVDRKANLIPFNGCSIDFDNGVNTCFDLDYSGELPDSGSISVDSDGIVSGSVGYKDRIFEIRNNKVFY